MRLRTSSLSYIFSALVLGTCSSAIAQQSSVTVSLDSSSPTVITTFEKGDTVTITAELDTTDENENGEGEPAIIYSSTGFSCTDNDYGLSHVCGTFVASASGTLFAYVVSADGDETATVTATINAAALKLGIFSPSVLDALDKAGDGLVLGAGIGVVVAAACAPPPQGFVTGPICTLPVGLVSAVTGLAGLSLNVLAKDPSDPNFMVIATPVVPTVPTVTASVTLTQSEADAFNALLLNEANIIGYGNALVTTINRAQGASDGGDAYWLSQQLVAATQYKTQLGVYLGIEATLRSNLEQMLLADPTFSTVQLTSSQILEGEAALDTYGLPAGISQELTALGADTPTQNMILELFVAQDINAEAGNVVTNIANPQGVAGTLSGLQSLLSGTTLSADIIAKSGPNTARLWTISLTNTGFGPLYGAEITSINLTQTFGSSCSPIVTSPAAFPLDIGNIAALASTPAAITIDFSGCAASARFLATVNFSADSGATSGTLTRSNQFQ
jgi:hypothetical protein